MKYEFERQSLNITLDPGLYCEEVIFKTFYWYGKSFSVSIARENDFWIVKLTPFQDQLKDEEAWNDVISKITQDLVDFKLRDIVNKETKIIRELLIAKAFAYDESCETPLTEITDPVGFNPMV